jgi:phosphoglucomutase
MIVTTTTSSSSLEIAKEWADILDPNPNTSKYTRDLIAIAEAESEASSKNDISSLLESLFPSDGSRITFGTAGLRSEMKPGPLGMNDVTVYQTAQGLAKYCLKMKQQQQQQQQESNSSNSKKNLCAVVGYDHRCNPSLNISSLSFAILTAIVFEEAGIDCILLDGLVLTPLVPFALKKLDACCGIMVTASHNPKQDNGYKLYASDGCQIRSPMDKDIANEILNNLKPWTDYEKILDQRRQNFHNDPCLGLSRPELTNQMLTEYFKAIKNSGLKTGQATMISKSNNSLDPSPSFAYTAMHGVGYQFAKKVFDIFELPPFKAVPEQIEPDPTFPTGTYALHCLDML